MVPDLKLLTPENADHEITASPDGKYFVDVYSTVTQPQTAVVRDPHWQSGCDVAKQDITKTWWLRVGFLRCRLL